MCQADVWAQGNIQVIYLQALLIFRSPSPESENQRIKADLYILTCTEVLVVFFLLPSLAQAPVQLG